MIVTVLINLGIQMYLLVEHSRNKKSIHDKSAQVTLEVNKWYRLELTKPQDDDYFLIRNVTTTVTLQLHLKNVDFVVSSIDNLCRYVIDDFSFEFALTSFIGIYWSCCKREKRKQRRM